MTSAPRVYGAERSPTMGLTSVTSAKFRVNVRGRSSSSAFAGCLRCLRGAAASRSACDRSSAISSDVVSWRGVSFCWPTTASGFALQRSNMATASRSFACAAWWSADQRPHGCSFTRPGSACSACSTTGQSNLFARSRNSCARRSLGGTPSAGDALSPPVTATWCSIDRPTAVRWEAAKAAIPVANSLKPLAAFLFLGLPRCQRRATHE